MEVDEPQAQQLPEQVNNAADPSPEAQDLTGDGGVMKTILKEGVGWETPRKGVEVAGMYYIVAVEFLMVIAHLGQ